MKRETDEGSYARGPRPESPLGRLRWDAGMSQKDMGVRIGLSNQEISRLENGKRPAGPEVREKYREALGMTPEEFERSYLEKESPAVTTRPAFTDSTDLQREVARTICAHSDGVGSSVKAPGNQISAWMIEHGYHVTTGSVNHAIGRLLAGKKLHIVSQKAQTLGGDPTYRITDRLWNFAYSPDRKSEDEPVAEGEAESVPEVTEHQTEEGGRMVLSRDEFVEHLTGLIGDAEAAWKYRDDVTTMEQMVTQSQSEAQEARAELAALQQSSKDYVLLTSEDKDKLERVRSLLTEVGLGLSAGGPLAAVISSITGVTASEVDAADAVICRLCK